MQRTKDQRGGGAVAQQLVDKKLRDLRGVVGIGKLALHRKGIGGEPLQQLLAKCANHLGLRIVDVGIDKARQQQLTAQVAIALLRVQKAFALLPRQQRLNASVAKKQHAILQIARLAGDIVGALGNLGDIEKCAANRRMVVKHHSCPVGKRKDRWIEQD